MVDTYQLACNACGRCCNSAPTLSLRELFRHRHRFVGALTLRRVPKRRTGERWQAGGREQTLDADDVAAADALADRLFHRGGGMNGEWLALTLQGYDYPSLGRCAALADDGRCGVHANKPSICRAVPLDPALPDRLQARVLAARRDDAAWLGANCIVEAGHVRSADESVFSIPLVTAGQVADRAALDAHRAALVFERAVWRDAVFASLTDGGQDVRHALSRLAPGGYLTVSIVPVLLAVAPVSAHCRALCIDFIDAQLALIGANIEAALVRRQAADRPATHELRGFAQALERARRALAAMPASAVGTRDDAPRIDAWLDDRVDADPLAA
ncbi:MULTISPECIES: YkgJ family cysteine cluster protein [Burkholderia]|uniref:YkgJ family cysteine cluster protein n=1 Tax=Burkholderia TaxID=32008 RepID=UPI0004F6C70D|nr:MULTISPECIES: YkgJ family cysteine cluster protein [Burkholderia]AIO45265.1 putative zinc-/iron-chelating domain protein [Burkholderia cepacia]ELW9529263.1 YkgJ family cysteine cluster protein [Burkholderia cenocepacia]KGC02086.1 putative zinc-/iron-chelating domain protein [Burkholderia cepacia]KWF19546.1 flagellin N-methylase [Burkholderia cenocepacia]MBG0872035.1 YkgJ family cysteine cluster protein [Burkholderia sp. 9777_1386]